VLYYSTLTVEPLNTLSNARAPTVIKDKMHMSGRSSTSRSSSTVLSFKGTNKVMDALEPWDLVSQKTLVARRKFQIQHSLSRHSNPMKFADVFFPGTPNVYNPKFLSQHQPTMFTNFKA
jgi:hypothetical protein